METWLFFGICWNKDIFYFRFQPLPFPLFALHSIPLPVIPLLLFPFVKMLGKKGFHFSLPFSGNSGFFPKIWKLAWYHKKARTKLKKYFCNTIMLILVYLAFFLFFLLHIFPSFPFLLLFLCPIIPTGLLPPSGVVCKVFSPPPPRLIRGKQEQTMAYILRAAYARRISKGFLLKDYLETPY